MRLHNSFEFVAYSYSNEYQFHTIIFNMYHTDIGEILWKLIHRIWNYNFDDIYIYYSTKESIYQYLLPPSSLFSILDVIRQYHISIACNSYPLLTSTRWIPNFIRLILISGGNEIFLKNRFAQNSKIWFRWYRYFPRKNFTIVVIVFILDSTRHTTWMEIQLRLQWFKDWQTDRKEVTGKESCKGLARKLIRFRPSDLKRIESWSLAISVRVLNLNAGSRGERISFFHHVFPTVENSTVLFLSGIMREPSCFPSSLLLEKVSPREIKLRNALPFAAQSSRPRFARAIWLSSVEYRISWKGFHPDPNLIERKK